jgi:anaerobic magnesium-protoporphyrin IX monomethyl ester cyclase
MGIKALLAQSPAVSPWVPRRQWEPPSVALATIAAQTDRHDVRVADMVIWRRQAPARFVRTLQEFRPRIVGLSAMTFQYETARHFAALAKQVDPGILTALGGYHATLFSDEIASSPDSRQWDFLVRGEGDFAFGELLDCVEAGGAALEAVLGLSWKQDGNFVHNPPRPLADLSRLKIPARDKRLARGFHMYFRRADAIETSRGCLHLCNFCSIREMYGRSFRLFPIERVLADVEDAYARGARHIFCTDDNITLDMDRFEVLMDGIIGLKLRNLVITTQASPIGFANRPGIAKKMVQAGFVSVFLGIENVSAKSLRAMAKPNTVEAIKRGVAELQREDISVIAGLINGLPHDDAESIRENYAFIKGLGINSVMDQLLTPYPKTDLRKEMLKQGLVANHDDFRWYDGYFANVRTEHLSPELLSFVRWKTRRDVIGMWRPTRADWKHFKGYTYLWEFGLRYLIWLNERLLELVFGVEGRYKIQMRQYLQLNDFGFEADGLDRGRPYHPLFGTAEDPFDDSRASLIRRRLPFRWRSPGPAASA